MNTSLQPVIAPNIANVSGVTTSTTATLEVAAVAAATIHQSRLKARAIHQESLLGRDNQSSRYAPANSTNGANKAAIEPCPVPLPLPAPPSIALMPPPPPSASVSSDGVAAAASVSSDGVAAAAFNHVEKGGGAASSSMAQNDGDRIIIDDSKDGDSVRTACQYQQHQQQQQQHDRSKERRSQLRRKSYQAWSSYRSDASCNTFAQSQCSKASTVRSGGAPFGNGKFKPFFSFRPTQVPEGYPKMDYQRNPRRESFVAEFSRKLAEGYDIWDDEDRPVINWVYPQMPIRKNKTHELRTMANRERIKKMVEREKQLNKRNSRFINTATTEKKDGAWWEKPAKHGHRTNVATPSAAVASGHNGSVMGGGGGGGGGNNASKHRLWSNNMHVAGHNSVRSKHRTGTMTPSSSSRIPRH